MIDHVLDGIITIDEQAIVQTFNPAAERIFGYQAGEVIGQNVKMLMPAPYRGQHDEYVSHYVQTGQARIIGIGREVVGRRKNGAVFPMDLAVSECRLGPRRMFVGIARDVSERKRAEQTFEFLADASATLADLVDYESALRRVARLAVPFFADWCAVDMLQSDGSLRRVAVAHADTQRPDPAREWGRCFPAGVDQGFSAAAVMRTAAGRRSSPPSPRKCSPGWPATPNTWKHCGPWG